MRSGTPKTNDGNILRNTVSGLFDRFHGSHSYGVVECVNSVRNRFFRQTLPHGIITRFPVNAALTEKMLFDRNSVLDQSIAIAG